MRTPISFSRRAAAIILSAALASACKPAEAPAPTVSATPATKATLVKSSFGTLKDGAAIDSYKLTNANGVSVEVITLGATLRSAITPDATGAMADILLGYDTPQEYIDKGNYLGVSVGRYANRIAKGKFSLDGKAYQLDTNDGANHLHGGLNGFDKRVWAAQSPSDDTVVMTLTSPDGDGGYPGELKAKVTYHLNDQNELAITYEATTDKPTIVNLTNHAYFNLGGVANGGILDHTLQINADQITPVDAGLIPTGKLNKVEGTPFDFRTPHAIGERIEAKDEQLARGKGYDHNWVLNKTAGELSTAAILVDPKSRRRLEVLTTSPAIQFYSGNFLDGTKPGKGGAPYKLRDALCLEPQVYPDAPNKPDFPSARLNPGETYINKIVLKFGVETAAPAASATP